MSYLLAAASSDGVNIDRHFGHADTFQIVELAEDGTNWQVIGQREVVSPCQHGSHAAEAMQAAVSRLADCRYVLADCRYVLAEAIGRGAYASLQAQGITPLETGDTLPISQAVEDLLRYERRRHKRPV